MKQPGPRVLIADDDEATARTTVRILNPEFDVIGVVRDGQAAVEAALKHQPDVAVIDILLPVLDGIQVTRRLKAANIKTKVLILTGLEHQEYLAAALAAGASGLVLKRKATHDLVHAINEILAGRTFPSREVF